MTARLGDAHHEYRLRPGPRCVLDGPIAALNTFGEALTPRSAQ